MTSYTRQIATIASGALVSLVYGASFPDADTTSIALVAGGFLAILCFANWQRTKTKGRLLLWGFVLLMWGGLWIAMDKHAGPDALSGLLAALAGVAHGVCGHVIWRSFGRNAGIETKLGWLFVYIVTSICVWALVAESGFVDAVTLHKALFSVAIGGCVVVGVFLVFRLALPLFVAALLAALMLLCGAIMLVGEVVAYSGPITWGAMAIEIILLSIVAYKRSEF